MKRSTTEPAIGTPAYYEHQANQCRQTERTDFHRFIGSAVMTVGWVMASATTALAEHDTKGYVMAGAFGVVAGTFGAATRDLHAVYHNDQLATTHYEAMAQVGRREA